MKAMRTASLFIVLSLLFGASSLLAGTGSAFKDKAYLICGYDDAADNTDVIILVQYNSDQNTVCLLQIPRDTYFNHGYGQNKLNQLYAHKLLSGEGSEAAMNTLVSELGEAVGISIAGYIGISTEVFCEVVDALGGFSVDLPQEVLIYGANGDVIQKFEKGRGFLNGADALILARNRKGYPGGDLARLNVQSLMIKGFFDRVADGVSYSQGVRFIKAINKANTNISLLKAMRGALFDLAEISGAELKILRLPGTAQTLYGVSYFVVDRPKARELIIHNFKKINGVFDPKNAFLVNQNPDD